MRGDEGVECRVAIVSEAETDPGDDVAARVFVTRGGRTDRDDVGARAGAGVVETVTTVEYCGR